MKLKPSVVYRPGETATITRNGDTLTINGESIDLSGDWVKLEWGEDEEKGLIQAGEKINGEPTITIIAYQPESMKRARSLGILDAMEQAITLNDGESVTFPDWFEENIEVPNA